VRLVYLEVVPDHTAALKREAELKKLKHAGKLRLIQEAEQNIAVQFAAGSTETQPNEYAAS